MVHQKDLNFFLALCYLTDSQLRVSGHNAASVANVLKRTRWRFCNASPWLRGGAWGTD